MASNVIVILGTGGTIAGQAASATDNVGYKAGQLSVASLVAAIPALAGLPLETEQVAQLDSKDMDFATWQRLAAAVDRHLARPEVGAVIITHGTDTLEETAYFLQRVLAPRKPVVMTAAMRPATALQADGPQNLLDAVAVAACPEATGVSVVLAGQVHGADQVQKAHSYRIDGFCSRDEAVVAWVEEGRVRTVGAWPHSGEALGLNRIARAAGAWPKVQILLNHASADGSLVQAMQAVGTAGIVVAGTGNGTLSQGLEQALLDAQAQGVKVLRSTRCQAGPVLDNGTGLASAGSLSPVKARVEMILQLLA
ncbi:MAG: asparaginase [Pelomonas sp.]|nr:asparaginase [Roseateles sp.]MBV8468819.1 asparaginase [Burkholderiaceae bacterium]MBV8604574.1 asparaginase [Roseateles sp.]